MTNDSNESATPERMHTIRRRVVGRVTLAIASLFAMRLPKAAAPDPAAKPEKRWFDAAAAMKRLAESWGDQPYGAVLVLDGTLIGEGPSRVVLRNDAAAHAEREAIRDAQRRLGRTNLAGSVLYSTSRPCLQCERAAAEAHVARMIYGAELNDGGRPTP